jgi:hypothetical protein
MPKPVVPLPVLLLGDFPVPGGGIETEMPQMLLQQSQTVTRIVYLHSMYAEGIPQPVGADTSYSSSFRIDQVWKTGPLGAISNYLPCSMPGKVKQGRFSIRGQGIDITLQHRQGGLINRKYPDTSFFLLALHLLADPSSAARTKLMPVAQPCPTLGARNRYDHLQVNYSGCALLKIYITHLECKSL